MNNVFINFNDAIYRHTGIRFGSVAMREETIRSDDGDDYRFQAVKTNSKGKETLFLTLKNAFGISVEDFQIRQGDRFYTINPEKSQDAVVIERFDHQTLKHLELISESASIRARVRISLEDSPSLVEEIFQTIRSSVRSAVQSLSDFLSIPAYPDMKWTPAAYLKEELSIEKVNLPSVAYGFGYRDGNDVILLDGQMKEQPPELEKIIRFLDTKIMRCYFQVLIKDNEKGWGSLFEKPIKIKKPFIRIENRSEDQFILLLHQQADILGTKTFPFIQLLNEDENRALLEFSQVMTIICVLIQ